MKRTAVLMVCVVALVVAAYTGSRLPAKTEAPARPAPPKTTHIAVLNLRFVVKNYKKYKAWTEEMKKLDKKYTDEVKVKSKKQEELTKQAADTTDADRREELERAARNLKREVEDISTNARKEFDRRNTEEIVLVYKEIREAATRYAKAKKIDLVLHFEGPADKEETDSPLLIKRLFYVGSAPLYCNESMEISKDILKKLNEAFDRSVRRPSLR